jgi:hypothetical protein
LGAWKQPLHGVGHHMRGRVANDRECVLVAAANRTDLELGAERRMQVDNAPVGADGHDVVVELPSLGEQLASGTQSRLPHQRNVTPLIRVASKMT